MQNSTINGADYVELGLAGAGVCQTLDLRIRDRGDDQLNPSTLGAIDQFTT